MADSVLVVVIFTSILSVVLSTICLVVCCRRPPIPPKQEHAFNFSFVHQYQPMDEGLEEIDEEDLERMAQEAEEIESDDDEWWKKGRRFDFPEDN